MVSKYQECEFLEFLYLRKIKVIYITFLLVISSSCFSAQSSESNLQALGGNSKLTLSAHSSQKNEAKVFIKKGMSYINARRILLNEGWLVPILPKGGYGKDDAKVISECSGNSDLCNKFPEIDSCSGSEEGNCNMYFHSRQEGKLSVTTSGGLGAGAIVESWSRR